MLFRSAALLVPLHDHDALAAALATVVTDDRVRGTLLAAGDQRWRNFTWQRCADGLIDLYRHAASEDVVAELSRLVQELTAHVTPA